MYEQLLLNAIQIKAFGRNFRIIYDKDIKTVYINDDNTIDIYYCFTEATIKEINGNIMYVKSPYTKPICQFAIYLNGNNYFKKNNIIDADTMIISNDDSYESFIMKQIKNDILWMFSKSRECDLAVELMHYYHDNEQCKYIIDKWYKDIAYLRMNIPSYYRQHLQNIVDRSEYMSHLKDICYQVKANFDVDPPRFIAEYLELTKTYTHNEYCEIMKYTRGMGCKTLPEKLERYLSRSTMDTSNDLKRSRDDDSNKDPKKIKH